MSANSKLAVWKITSVHCDTVQALRVKLTEGEKLKAKEIMV